MLKTYLGHGEKYIMINFFICSEPIIRLATQGYVPSNNLSATFPLLFLHLRERRNSRGPKLRLSRIDQSPVSPRDVLLSLKRLPSHITIQPRGSLIREALSPATPAVVPA